MWATDPQTGEEGPRTVEALIEGTGEKVLVEVLTADGGTFTATDGHPIWEMTSQDWKPAVQLEIGDVLLGEDGPVTATGLNVSVEWATVYNLTVEDIHTYSVSNGVDEILTHNCGDITDADITDDTIVIRNGQNLPDQFENGSGVVADVNGNLSGVSVTAVQPGQTAAETQAAILEASRSIKNTQIVVTTVGEVRAAGGSVVADPTRGNPNHCLISGCDAATLSEIFTPTRRNPSKPQ